MAYYALRQFSTRRRSYQTGDLVDLNQLTGIEAADAVSNGSLISQEALTSIAGKVEFSSQYAGLGPTVTEAAAAGYGGALYIAHRGGSFTGPENSREAYRTALGYGIQAIEQDCRMLADNGLGVMHDATIDRTTTGSGNVVDQSSVSWKNLSMDASAFLGGGWVDGIKPPLFTEVVNEFGNRAVLVPESKGNSVAYIINALELGGVSKSTVIIQSFDIADCLYASQRGWPALWLDGSDLAQAQANGVTWVGPDSTWVGLTSGFVADAHSRGIKIAPYVVNRRNVVDSLLALGCDGFFSDDPAYIARLAQVQRKTDPFKAQSWVPGMQAYSAGERGVFYSPDGWGMNLNTTAKSFVLQGWWKPTDPSNYVLNIKIQIDAVNAADTSKWLSVFVSTNDLSFNDTSLAGCNGYHCLFRANGTIALYRVDAGVATQVATASTSAVTLGTTVATFTLTVTGSSVTWARTDSAGSASANDTTYRSLAYLVLGRNAAGGRFSGISVN